MKKKRIIGLVLGSGAARGFSQIGVINALMEKGVKIDLIVGTSIGAIVGACYAKMMKEDWFQDSVSGESWKDLFMVADLRLEEMFEGFADEKKITKWLHHVIGDVRFEELHIPFAVVAADANTGEEVVIKEGSVLNAVKASISIPLLFDPVRHGKRLLIDGAFVNPVPVDIAKEMGATFLIACDTTRAHEDKKVNAVKQKLLKKIDAQNRKFVHNAFHMKKTFRKLFNNASANAYERRRNIDRNVLRMFRALKQTLQSIETEMVKAQLQNADVIISPDVGHIDMLAFSQGKEAIIKGYEAAKKVLEKLGSSLSGSDEEALCENITADR